MPDPSSAAGPSAAPLIVEFAAGGAVALAFLLRRPARRALGSARRRIAVTPRRARRV